MLKAFTCWFLGAMLIGTTNSLINSADALTLPTQVGVWHAMGVVGYVLHFGAIAFLAIRIAAAMLTR